MLGKSVTLTSAELNGFNLQSSRKMLIWTNEDDSLTRQLRQILKSVEGERLPVQTQIAKQFQMTAYNPVTEAEGGG